MTILSSSGDIPPTISFITARDRTYFNISNASGPHSSVTRLIQGVWETDPRYARAILRKRIFTTDALSPLNWGMAKTAAQRISHLEEITLDELWTPVDYRPTYIRPPLSPPLLGLPPMELAHELSRLPRRESELFASDRPVGCVLIGADSEILHWAHNTNRTNRTLHAEVNLVQSWWDLTGGPIPHGARIYTTLEPCRMCQGMIYACGPGTLVLFAAPDGVPPVSWPLRCQLSNP